MQRAFDILRSLKTKRPPQRLHPDFRHWSQAATGTGARYGDWLGSRLPDFNPDVGTVNIRHPIWQAGHIVLTDEGRAFLRQLTAGRAGDERPLQEADGQCGRCSSASPIADAVRRAKIKPRFSFHGLRHTWASHAAMNGVPLLVVPKNLGHSDNRMVEKHYATWHQATLPTPSARALLSLDFKPDKSVVALRGTL